jgi:hypothetical protein
VSIETRLAKLESARRPTASLAERLHIARTRAAQGNTAPKKTRAELEAEAKLPGLVGRLARAHLRCED